MASLTRVKYRNSMHGKEAAYDPGTGYITLCTEDPAAYLHELMHKYDAKLHELRGGQDSEQEIVAGLGASVLVRLYEAERSAGNHMACIAAYAKVKTPAEAGTACG